ncbi:DUF5994 family protein [Micromonospora auratinigra]|uniref:Uncharacterized protein n=1 Tax=Micromonospora auratinigra TaxID=261654 RepID=A0A1A9A5L1_9ACTN|nr:DUF5994 family protein [Micromonospora auratinigra]SBT51407.1 hypothetical protein GA0070611_5164 [Micromonospora auratinigra]
MVRSAEERMTWVCTGQPPTARLRLADPPSRRKVVDGGWWPTSRDPVVELSSLVRALTARGYDQIERIMLQPAAWDSRPTRIGVDGAVVRVGWFATLSAGLVIVTGPRDLRVDLAVTAPESAQDVATAAMLAASRPAGAAASDDLLIAAGPVGHRRSDEGVAAWETEGGHVSADRQPAAPARS